MPPVKNQKDEIFPEVSNSIWVVSLFWIWMFSIIAASNLTGLRNQYGAINPVVMFSLGFFGLASFAFREADSLPELKQALGFDTPLPGFGILSLINGLGAGAVIYAVFTGQLLSVAGNQTLTSIAQPFYNPYTASATPFLLGSVASAFGVLFVNAYVASFEEIYKIGMVKITSDWIRQRTGLPVSVCILIAVFVTFILWGSWHYFSWNGLSIVSIVMAVMYGVFFYTAYVVLSASNIFPLPKVGNSLLARILAGLTIYPAIGSHYSWNVLVATDGLSLTGTELALGGGTLFIFSLVFMYVSRKVFG